MPIKAYRSPRGRTVIYALTEPDQTILGVPVWHVDEFYGDYAEAAALVGLRELTYDITYLRSLLAPDNRRGRALCALFAVRSQLTRPIRLYRRARRRAGRALREHITRGRRWLRRNEED